MNEQQANLLHSNNLGSVWQEGRLWRRGITTGTCATAAAKAAAKLLLTDQAVQEIIVDLPSGQQIIVPVESSWKKGNKAICSVLKDGGDDPDITHGLAIIAEVSWSNNREGIIIFGGQGVGMVTKPGLAIPPGEAAINPVPRQMIRDNLCPLLAKRQGLNVTISVPGGQKAARQTMNPQLGILGGISILGTSGLVEPMSEEAFKNSLLVRVEQIKAQGHQTLILVPGRMGERAAEEKYGLPSNLIAQVSNFMGFMLEEATYLDFRRILIVGHLGKTVKLSAGIFHTHNRIADGRLETIAAWLGTLGAGPDFLQLILKQVTTEGAIELIKEAEYTEVFTLLANRAEKRCQQYLRGQEVQVGLVLTDLKGEALGIGQAAHQIGGNLDWTIE